MRLFTFIILLLSYAALPGQVITDPWICSQLGKISWHQTYEGVLADYHPVTITLASDNHQIVGYLTHKGDSRSHRLMGDWNKKDLFQLQERDEFDRLTGYLKGSITGDLVHMEWMSADQSRMFNIVAYPKNLIKIKNFKPTGELIRVSTADEIVISVQKMDFGIVSGIVNRKGFYSRFEGYCLDGSCSIWNTVFQNPGGAPIRVQMRQRDGQSYRVVMDGKEFPATISYTIPLAVRQYDNSVGFLDFVYPQFESKAFSQWMGRWVDKMWTDGIAHLTSINQPGTSGRLVHRSSGWIEIFDQNESYVSGMITFINPGSTQRESFVWLKKEDLFLSPADLLNTPEDLKKAALLSMKLSAHSNDDEYLDWLRGAGFTFLLPTAQGVVMLTEFNMIYGDEISRLPLSESKYFIRRKYWKYFGW